MSGEQPTSFREYRESVYDGDRADMQFKFLARMNDEPAADAIAEVLARVGEALDTGELTGVRDAVYETQVAATGPTGPTVDNAPTWRTAHTPPCPPGWPICGWP